MYLQADDPQAKHNVPHVLLHNSSAKLFCHLSLDRQMSRQALHINRKPSYGALIHRAPTRSPVPHLSHTYTHHHHHCPPPIPLCQHLQSKHNTMTAHKHSAGRSQRRHICDLRWGEWGWGWVWWGCRAQRKIQMPALVNVRMDLWVPWRRLFIVPGTSQHWPAWI